MTTPRTPRASLRIRLIGLVATLALFAFVFGTPLVLLGIRALPSLSDFTWSRLTSPDDGTLVLAVITVVAWVAWAIFTVSVVLAIGARIRGMRAPRLPGLTIPQLAAGRLVGIAALLFVGLPTATTIAIAASAPHAAAAPEPPTHIAPTVAAVQTASKVTTAPEAQTAPVVPVHRTEPYTVRRGDSLWKIAEKRLGDGTKYAELLDLNQGVLGDRPDFLVPGTVIRVPIVATDEGKDETYVVQPGDTLSEIAQDELGHADAYPEIFDASRETRQPDGEHLTDPDLIRPGWHLTIPGEKGTPSPAEHEQVTPRPSAPVARRSPDEPSASATSADARPAVAADSELPSWVLPGLAASGAALAGSLLLVLRRYRRAQLRHRTPGHALAPSPRELRAAEKSIRASGSVTAPRIDELDRALRSLPATPPVFMVALTPSTITLTLAESVVLDSPWTGADTTWTVNLAEVEKVVGPGEVSAPYPLLVGIGQAYDGGLVFLNLEQVGTLTIDGDPERAVALARHLAVEFATAPWSALVEIDAIGLGIDLAALDPARVRSHAAGDTTFLGNVTDELRGSDPGIPPDRFRAVILADTSDSETEESSVLAKAIATYDGRAAVALINVSDDSAASGTTLDIAEDGTAALAGLDLQIHSAGLTTDEALACARLVEVTRATTPIPVPVPDDSDAVADPSGALTARLTEPRPTGPGGKRSVLPASALVYADRAAVTVDEIDEIAPQASEDAHPTVVDSDPDLDEDLARWESLVPVAPKLTLLGPVNARVLGDVTRGARRRPYLVELLAYLVLHPEGVTAERLAGDMGIGEKKARDDLSTLRLWLGADRSTGTPYLPPARKSRTRGEKALYRVEGASCDLDLFRRLRARGESRGPDGLDDLVAALHLVSGEPFTDLRAAGWGWLLEGERLDLIMGGAIVDVGHLVTTRALGENDLELAQFASGVALGASPYDEPARLDLVAVEAALGHADKVRALVQDTILDRADDCYGPVETPERTVQILQEKGWMPRQRRSG